MQETLRLEHVGHQVVLQAIDQTLTALKQASVEAYNLWRLCDSPRSGLVNKIRLEAKYKYKIALKQATVNEYVEFDDEISNLYLR